LVRPAERLKEIRGRLGITTREVAEGSQVIAEREGNSEYYISNAWLTQLENSESVPSIFKVFSLSAIYRVPFRELLLIFGVNLDNIGKHQLAAPPRDTRLAEMEVPNGAKTVSFPVRFDPAFNLNRTSLLSRLVEVWGEIPIAFIQHLDIRQHNYGYIGMDDLTLYPLLRPGSFVQIDPKVRKIQPAKWRTEFDRPIYFVELRDGYGCGWCELQKDQLWLLPHPLSPVGVRQFEHGLEAEIVGQVTGIATRIVDQDAGSERGNTKSLRQS
jgi:transcriptional regulator with XRE-family HTH domain